MIDLVISEIEPKICAGATASLPNFSPTTLEQQISKSYARCIRGATLMHILEHPALGSVDPIRCGVARILVRSSRLRVIGA
jgi:hypothetical protein